MERKGNMAELEVNDLTTRNEELTQQLQSLQEQLESIEQRREIEKESQSREKNQWLQMLEHGRQIQARAHEDNKRLAEHVSKLQSEQIRNREDRGAESPRSEASSSEVTALRKQVEHFSYVLRTIKRHNKAMDEQGNDLLLANREIGRFIRQALCSELFIHGSEVVPASKSAGTASTSRLKSKTTRGDSEPASGCDGGLSHPVEQDSLDHALPHIPQQQESKDVDASAFHGRFRAMSDYEEAIPQDSRKVYEAFAGPRSPPDEYPDQLNNDDASSFTSTQARNSKSPISVSDEPKLLFGTALTPVSTLPPPNSASSMQRTYFGDGSGYSDRQKQGVDGAEAMPPPPPRPTASVSSQNIQ